jgi:hypothetical protein
MIRKRTFFGAVAAVALAMLVPAGASSAQEDPRTDWVSVDAVLVNRLGGVSVSGQFQCLAAYDQLWAGELQGLRETESGEEWYTIPAPEPGDKVVLLVNADNYLVKQPAGKRLMIKAEHWSSRMTPCVAEQRQMPDGSEISNDKCPSDLGPCRWETDRYAYDRQAFGPLFDYADNGKFKVGNLNVEVFDYGVAVMIFDSAGNFKEDHMAPYAADVYFNDIVRAVSYR